MISRKKHEECNNNLVHKTHSEEKRHYSARIAIACPVQKAISYCIIQAKTALETIEIYQKKINFKRMKIIRQIVLVLTNPNVNTSPLSNPMTENIINAGGMNSDSGSSINNSFISSLQFHNTSSQAEMAPQGFNMAQATSQAQTLKIHLNKIQPSIQNLQNSLQNVWQQQ